VRGADRHRLRQGDQSGSSQAVRRRRSVIDATTARSWRPIPNGTRSTRSAGIREEADLHSERRRRATSPSSIRTRRQVQRGRDRRHFAGAKTITVDPVTHNVSVPAGTRSGTTTSGGCTGAGARPRTRTAGPIVPAGSSSFTSSHSPAGRVRPGPARSSPILSETGATAPPCPSAVAVLPREPCVKTTFAPSSVRLSRD
jgi:hypothetical protein